MSSSKVWVNEEFVGQKRRIKRVKKKRYSVPREKVTAVEETKEVPYKSKSTKATRASHQSTNLLNEGNPNLLDTLGRLSTMAQKLDLVKIRNQLTEINQIVDQVNGVIQGFQQHNRNSYELPYIQQPKYPQQNVSYQPPHGKQHPYSSYRPR